MGNVISYYVINNYMENEKKKFKTNNICVRKADIKMKDNKNNKNIKG